MKNQITEEIKKEFEDCRAREVTINSIDFVSKTGYDWFARIVVDGVSCKVGGTITEIEVIKITEWV